MSDYIEETDGVPSENVAGDSTEQKPARSPRGRKPRTAASADGAKRKITIRKRTKVTVRKSEEESSEPAEQVEMPFIEVAENIPEPKCSAICPPQDDPISFSPPAKSRMHRVEPIVRPRIHKRTGRPLPQPTKSPSCHQTRVLTLMLYEDFAQCRHMCMVERKHHHSACNAQLPFPK